MIIKHHAGTVETGGLGSAAHISTDAGPGVWFSRQGEAPLQGAGLVLGVHGLLTVRSFVRHDADACPPSST